MAKLGDAHKRAPLRGQRARDRMRRRRVARILILLILGAGLLVGIWHGTRAEVVTLTTVDVSGAKTIDLAAVEQEVQTILNGSYLFIVPKRFRYTYPHDAIVTAVEHIPRIAHATVTHTSRTTLSVVLTEYTPYALWCANQVAGSSGSTGSNGCLFISEEGFAFAEAPSLQGATFLRYMTEKHNPEVGTSVASLEYMQATKQFTQALMSRHGMYVSVIVETKDGDVQYRVRGGGELFVSKNADAQKVFENLDAILASAEFKHITSGNFVYIDLRFGNKVFVKEFNDTPEIENNEQSTTTSPTVIQTMD
jgi:cell division septal protein FtsQ